MLEPSFAILSLKAKKFHIEHLFNASLTEVLTTFFLLTKREAVYGCDFLIEYS